MKQTFSANLEKHIFQCFSCGAKGNVLDFCVLMEGGNPENGKDIRKTAAGLIEAFNLKGGTPPKNAARKDEPAPSVDVSPETPGAIVNAPLDFALKNLDPKHPYLLGRGFTPETIAYFGLGFCSRGHFKDRVVVPIHDERNALVGYAGRVVDDKSITAENPKYRFPGSRERKGVIYEFRKSRLVYNANRIEKAQNCGAESRGRRGYFLSHETHESIDESALIGFRGVPHCGEGCGDTLFRTSASILMVNMFLRCSTTEHHFQLFTFLSDSREAHGIGAVRAEANRDGTNW